MRKLGTIILAFSIVFYPIIGLINVGPINLGDILLLISIFFLVPYIDLKKCEIHLIPIIIYSIIHFVFFGYLQYDLFTTFFHYVFFLIIIIWFVPNFVQFDKLFFFLKYLILINGSIIIIQFFLMKGFSVYLLSERRIFTGENIAYFDSLHPRPFGLFSEPSSYAFSCIIFLTILLFKYEKVNVFYMIISVLSLILCKSASGIALGSIVFVYYFFKKFKSKLRNVKLLLSFLILIIIACVVFVNSGGLKFFLSHIYDFENGQMSHAMSNRIGDLTIYLKVNNTIISNFFGRGYVEIDTDYTPGITRQLVYSGLIGTVIFYYCIFKQFKRINTFVTIMLAICVLFNFFSTTMVGVGPLLWMPFCIVQEKKYNSILA